MRLIISAACGLWLIIAGPSVAQTSSSEPVVVVELYTSQGCSSCPPADEFFAMLASDSRVIPLALHVDYWDYIGWADKFADPHYTARQRAYAKAIGSRTIYTPQMIVEGVDFVEGHNPEAVGRLIDAQLAKGSPVVLTLQRTGGDLKISAQANPPLSHAVKVQLVRYRPQQTVDIGHGENAGRTVTYHNIVTSWQVLGDWAGTAPLALDAVVEGDEPIVVILQENGPAAILAAARID
ncbi:MAG: DUF1223 domain-containing protein [Paracoccaceae bacterium]